MPLPKDPLMLLSVVNTRLRDRFDSLVSLCEDLEISDRELCGRLEAVGFAYDAGCNQFRRMA